MVAMKIFKFGRYVRGLASLAAFALLCHANTIFDVDHPEAKRLEPERAETNDARLGLHQLSNPPNPTVDIVAIHGLDGHWKRSWQADNGVFWLEDLLPYKLTQARIYSYGYDSRTRFGDVPLTQDIADHAQELMSALVYERELTDSEQIPIIFIGHSLGGLVVKSALLLSNMGKPGHLERQKAIKLSTCGVLFLGTPHQGGEGIDRLKILISILSHFTRTNDKVIDQIKPNSDWLQELQSAYNSISQDFETVFFYETWEMPIYVGPIYSGKQIMVPKYSAVVQGAPNAESVALAADHSTMAKFPSPVDANFQKIAVRLQSMEKKAGSRIRLNWELWNAHKSHFLKQIAWDAPMKPYDQEFNLGLRIDEIRNIHFTGRQITLLHLDEMLRSSPNGASLNIAVLYGIGGIGKTQISVEYAYRFQSHYSAVFRIDGSREDVFIGSILRCLRLIKIHYEIHGLQYSPRWKLLNETLDEFKNQPSDFVGLNLELKQKFQDCLKSWLSFEENQSWLMIIDNVDDLESYDYRTILPSTVWGSILITSRRADLAINWKSIEVVGMDEPDALELLSRSGGLNLEVNSSEWMSGTKLVRELDYFPLAIIGAGAYIKSRRISRNPVSSYLDLYNKEPKTLLSHRSAPAGWNYRQETVMTTWEVSYEAIREQLPEAVELLRYCGFLHRGIIKEHFFVHFFDAPVVKEAFQLLSSYSFIHPSKRDRFSMHPLLHLWIRERLEPKQQIDTAEKLLSTLFWGNTCEECDNPGKAGLYSSSHVGFLFSLYTELSPCEGLPDPAILMHPTDAPPTGINLFSETAYIIQGWALWTRSKLDEAMRYVYRTLFNDDFSVLQDWERVDRLRTIQRHRYQWGFPESVSKWTLCRAMKVLPHRHPRVLEIAGNYAFFLIEEAKKVELHDEWPHTDPFKMAELWYQWILEARTQVLGPNHPATAGAMMGLGMALANQNHGASPIPDSSELPGPVSKVRSSGVLLKKDHSECENAILYLITACNIRISALGYDDSLSNNVMFRLVEVSTFPRCISIHPLGLEEAIEWFMHAIENSGGAMEAPTALMSNAANLVWQLAYNKIVSRTTVGLAVSVWPWVKSPYLLIPVFEVLLEHLHLVWEHDELRDTVHGIMSPGAVLPPEMRVSSHSSRLWETCYLAGLVALFSSLWYSITGDSAEAARWLHHIFAPRFPTHDQLKPAFAAWSELYTACMGSEIKDWDAVKNAERFEAFFDGVAFAFYSGLGQKADEMDDIFTSAFEEEEDDFDLIFVYIFFATNIQRTSSLNPNWEITRLLEGFYPNDAHDDFLPGMIHILDTWDWHERALYFPSTLPVGLDRCWGGFCPGLAFRDQLKDSIDELLGNRNNGNSCFACVEKWSMCRAG